VLVTQLACLAAECLSSDEREFLIAPCIAVCVDVGE
jgi:hypothetical protein